MLPRYFYAALRIATIAAILKLSLSDDAAWRDSRGLSCADYTNSKFCLHGSYGPKWRFDVDKLFKHYANADADDASDMCCECILSSSDKYQYLNCPPRTATDSHIWYDSIGHTCAYYADFGLCQDGGYGTLWYNLFCYDLID